MSIYSIYEPYYNYSPIRKKQDKFPICFSTLKPYLAVNLEMLGEMSRGVAHFVPIFNRFHDQRFQFSSPSHNIMRSLTGLPSLFEEMNTPSEGYYVSWMFLFHKLHKKENRETISIMMMPVVPSRFVDPDNLSSHSQVMNLVNIKQYLEIWINPEFKDIHLYLYRQIEDNIFPLLELERIPIIRKPEDQMWEKAIVEYRKPNFSSIEEATSYGEQLYKMSLQNV